MTSEQIRVDSDGRSVVVIGLLGTTLDVGKGPKRWERWRPTICLCQQPDFRVDHLELIHPRRSSKLASEIAKDIAAVSPETAVRRTTLDMRDPWDFEEVYGALHEFASTYVFDTARFEYLIHITTGTHVAQICSFLLTEARYFPARLIQTAPPRRDSDGPGVVSIIDLDLSKYDRLATRFEKEHQDAVSSLKGGIETQNKQFNSLIEQIEHVAARTSDPMLLVGPTGAGKTQLARRIYLLRKHRHLVDGPLVEVNCATLRGDGAMSTLFGHKRGAFTGANKDRPGLLRSADGGLLFLDEIGELGLDEQAMLLRAIEEKRFLPMGSDREVSSDFQFLAGTNRDLAAAVSNGSFREDLLARINLWSFALPGLCDRREDIEPNLDYELERFAAEHGSLVRFNAEARRQFLSFAASVNAKWSGNFRDLRAALTRMATLAPGGRITADVVEQEKMRLEHGWNGTGGGEDVDQCLASVVGEERLRQIDRFDRAQLAAVIETCRQSRSLSEAGRMLFAVSRTQRATRNDSDRLRKYLARFELRWADITS